MIVSMVNDLFVIALDVPLQNYTNFDFTNSFLTSRLTVVVRNMNESVWKAAETSGNLNECFVCYTIS